jgi:hypothetical protein
MVNPILGAFAVLPSSASLPACRFHICTDLQQPALRKSPALLLCALKRELILELLLEAKIQSFWALLYAANRL